MRVLIERQGLSFIFKEDKDMILKSILEFIVVALLVWGFFNEDRFIAFEDKLVTKLAAKIKAKRLAAYQTMTNELIDKEIRRNEEV